MMASPIIQATFLLLLSLAITHLSTGGTNAAVKKELGQISEGGLAQGAEHTNWRIARGADRKFDNGIKNNKPRNEKSDKAKRIKKTKTKSGQERKKSTKTKNKLKKGKNMSKKGKKKRRKVNKKKKRSKKKSRQYKIRAKQNKRKLKKKNSKKFLKVKKKHKKNKNKSKPNKRKPGQIRGENSEDVKQTFDASVVHQKNKDNSKIGNNLRQLKRIKNRCKQMDSKASKSSEFDATVATLNKAINSGSGATEKIISIRDELVRCSSTVKKNCQLSVVDCQSDVITSCESPLQNWIDKFNPSSGSCSNAAEGYYACISALPAAATLQKAGCLQMAKIEVRVKANRKKCISGNVEGSFGYCRKLQGNASEVELGPANCPTSTSPVTIADQSQFCQKGAEVLGPKCNDDCPSGSICCFEWLDNFARECCYNGTQCPGPITITKPAKGTTTSNITTTTTTANEITTTGPATTTKPAKGTTTSTTTATATTAYEITTTDPTTTTKQATATATSITTTIATTSDATTSTDCITNGRDVETFEEAPEMVAETWKECSQMCRAMTECTHWVWRLDDWSKIPGHTGTKNACYRKVSSGKLTAYAEGLVTGDRNCGGSTTTTTTTTTANVTTSPSTNAQCQNASWPSLCQKEAFVFGPKCNDYCPNGTICCFEWLDPSAKECCYNGSQCPFFLGPTTITKASIITTTVATTSKATTTPGTTTTTTKVAPTANATTTPGWTPLCKEGAEVLGPKCKDNCPNGTICCYELLDLSAKECCYNGTQCPLSPVPSQPDWIAKKLIPLGFDIARGYYSLHDYDTEKLFPESNQKINCSAEDKRPFRTITGICNNLNNPSWGSSNTGYKRLLPPAYEDGKNNEEGCGIPRGGQSTRSLPSARDISIRFHWQINRINPRLSNLFYQFGQFVSHDSGLTPEVNVNEPGPDPNDGGFNNTACASNTKYRNNSKCFNINIKGDSFYYNRLPNYHQDNYPYLGFARTLPVNQCNKTSPREQVNAGTGFHDASIVYGFNYNLSQKLRTKEEGEMKTSESNNLLPNICIQGDSCVGLKNVTPVAGGDPRVNIHPWLLSVQTLFLREHNRLAKAIRNCTTCGGNLSDEEIFENSRRILIAEYQNIVYTEFLPLVIGADAMNKHRLTPTVNSNYLNDLDPTIFNGFQTAAMRFGHSMVQEGTLGLQNLTDGNPLPEGLEFRKEYFNDNHYYNDNGKGNDEVLGGMTIQGCQRTDRHVSRDLTHYLFDVKGENNYGDDLAARNIQRGRDHGLPPYMKYREHFSLGASDNSADRIKDISEPYWELLMDIYKFKPEDIDLWTGGLAEEPGDGAVVGPLFQEIIGKQFYHSKFGDRFFFTHEDQTGSFTESQQEILKKRTMRDIICQNSKIPKVRKHALEIKEDEDLIPCNNQLNQFNNICDLIKCL